MSFTVPSLLEQGGMLLPLFPPVLVDAGDGVEVGGGVLPPSIHFNCPCVAEILQNEFAPHVLAFVPCV